ncbi:hypothetical protein HK098_006465 [Nowakowskiella sp. JEL0407]|nr:hypothetical protein HK098_006465 [Nowakowskiella sp. JEL0407]
MLAVALFRRVLCRSVLPHSTPPTPTPLTPLTLSSCSPLGYSQVRPKTYRKKDSRARLRLLKRRQERIAAGKPPQRPYPNRLETKFYKVINNMKVYKNTSNGQRRRRMPTRFHLHKRSCIKRLSFGKRSTGGRNHHGRITIRSRGGGHKKRVRNVDFYRNTPGPHMVVRLEYDPNRSAELCLLRNLSTNGFSYVIRQQDVNVGDVLFSWRSGVPDEIEQDESSTNQQNQGIVVDHFVSRSKMIQKGNCLPLHAIPVGTIISCISLRPGGPAKLCRSAGTYGQLLSVGTPNAQGKIYANVRLQSKEVRLFDINCCATIGPIGNSDHHNRIYGKAGIMRHKGWRPSVRGIAMSPYDHPHGGGRKSKGNKAPRSPWGWKTKGWKTNRGPQPWHIGKPISLFLQVTL